MSNTGQLYFYADEKQIYGMGLSEEEADYRTQNLMAKTTAMRDWIRNGCVKVQLHSISVDLIAYQKDPKLIRNNLESWWLKKLQHEEEN